MDAELRELRRLRQRPLPQRLLGYFRLGGPGFMDAALTLGAGTLTAAMLSGATFGYKTLWLLWISMGLGLFMMAAMARFTTRGHGIVALQNRYHGVLFGSVMTALVGSTAVAIVFNFGQVSLGTHLLESLAAYGGLSFPRDVNWVLYTAFTGWLTLSYGRKGRSGIRFVETFMKLCIAVMLVAFGACLAVTGVDWGAALRGTFVPWLPSGGEGLDLFVASSAAAVGIMDWFFFNYAGLARGWGKEHEPLARFDMTFGLFLPFVLVNFLVVAVFAETLLPSAARPETATELARALEPLLGARWAPVLFYLGFLAVPVSTTVGMSIAGAMAIHAAFGWSQDTSSLRWRVSALLPQIAFVAVWYPRPVWLVIAIGAFLSLTDNIVAWSYYLLVNDERALGEDRCRSRFWNFGLLLQVTLLNCIAIIYVFNRLGWWVH
ncbi:MAG TPA: divalent metal cation transporter [Vicinamibacteria bacterium]|nr:divalent metal cation transporter [Vicinamibacteria bacterium]